MSDSGHSQEDGLEIDVVNRQRTRKVALAPVRRLLRHLTDLEPARAGASGFAVAFVSDRRMRSLNRIFRGRDAITDVLSFPGEGPWLGDIAISIDRARAQAREQGRHASEEIRMLLVHGYLHLNGYDHETDDGRMMRRQRVLLARLDAPAARSLEPPGARS